MLRTRHRPAGLGFVIGLDLWFALAAVAALSAVAADDPSDAGRTAAGQAAAGHVAATRLAAGFHRGVNHAHIHRRGHGYGSKRSARHLADLRALGVDSIAITPFGYQHHFESDRVFGFPGHEGNSEFFQRTDRTMTDRDLGDEIRSAHDLKMRVVLKPHVWSGDFWGGAQWHGTIRQKSPEAHGRWWASYRALVLHHARLAQRFGADVYCIGTELQIMTGRYPDEWRQLIRDVRAVYRGPLTYAAHHGREFEQIVFWEDLDLIGICAYFPLDVPDGADVAQLMEAWRPHRRRIEAVHGRVKRPVLFMEVGYRPVTGTHRRPWEHSGGRFDAEAQRRAYQAVFESFVDARWWRGIYIWKTFTDPQRASRRGDARSFSFRGRPAQDVVRRWFNGE